MPYSPGITYYGGVDYAYGQQQQQAASLVSWPTVTAGNTDSNIQYYYYGSGTNAVTYQNYTPCPITYQYQTQTQFIGQWNGNYGTYEETPEQKLKRELASKRAEELLLLHLSDNERKQYLEFGYFETNINDKTYRINKGRAGNVYLIEGGKTKYKYCAHPNDYTPEQDAMLAQLLMLKTDEDRFIKTANRTTLG